MKYWEVKLNELIEVDRLSREEVRLKKEITPTTTPISLIDYLLFFVVLSLFAFTSGRGQGQEQNREIQRLQ